MRGSIIKRGTSWRLVFDVQSADGKRKQRTVTVRGSYKDAQKELTRLLRAADVGSLPDPTRQTVGEYLKACLDGARTWSGKTRERYNELFVRQIVPHLGAVPLQRLKPEHVSAWHAKLLDAGLSTQTVVHAHRVLSLALKIAVENGTLARNVAAIRKPPKVEAREIEILKPDQITVLMAGLEGHVLHPIAQLCDQHGPAAGRAFGPGVERHRPSAQWRRRGQAYASSRQRQSAGAVTSACH
jgi:hypothetical protein